MKRLKGLFRDGRFIDQPEGTYRNARNIVISEELGAIVNEQGTTLLAALPIGTTVIGHRLLSNNKLVLFLKGIGAPDQIGVYDPEEYEYTTVLSHPELSFGSYVDSIAITNNFGENVVYWVDGKNPPRFLNLDNPII